MKRKQVHHTDYNETNHKNNIRSIATPTYAARCIGYMKQKICIKEDYFRSILIPMFHELYSANNNVSFISPHTLFRFLYHHTFSRKNYLNCQQMYDVWKILVPQYQNCTYFNFQRVDNQQRQLIAYQHILGLFTVNVWELKTLITSYEKQECIFDYMFALFGNNGEKPSDITIYTMLMYKTQNGSTLTNDLFEAFARFCI